MKSKYAGMSAEDLLNEESQLRTSLFNLRVQNTTKALENTAKIRQTRRELARLLTAKRAAELQGQAK